MRWHDSDHAWSGAPFEPRRWQAEALPRIVDALGEAPVPSIVQAIMGAGKSMLIAELAFIAELEGNEVIVVTTPSKKLVEQLAATVAARVGADRVGRFFSEAKEVDRPVIVACLKSTPRLALELATQHRKCALWIADEAHRTECDTVLTAHSVLIPERAVGFSATPYRSSRREELSLWRQEIYRYDVRSALADGVIVPWRVVPWSGVTNSELDDVCLRMVRHGLGYGPGMVSAVDCEDAEGFAAVLRQNGVRARAIHSRQIDADNDEALRGLERGQLDVVVHVSMLQEGVDLPWLRWLCMRRPGCTSVRFAQEVGRVLRAHPGKTEAIVYDPHDHFATYELTLESVLEGMAEAGRETVLACARIDGAWVAQVDPLLGGFWPGREVLVEVDDAEIVTRIVDVFDLEVRFAHRFGGQHATVIFAPPPARCRSFAREAALIPMSKLLEAHACTLTPVEAYLRQVTVSLSQQGLIDRLTSRREWRQMPASAKQVALIQRQMQGCVPHVNGVPEPHRSALRMALRSTRKLSQGAAGDLVRVLAAIRLCQGWPDRADLELLEVA